MSEHCIKIIIPVTGEFGTEQEQIKISALGKALDMVLESGHEGEFDGDEYGDGMATLYLYGPDAERLYAKISPFLARAELPAQSYALLRFGPPDDPNVKTRKIPLS